MSDVDSIKLCDISVIDSGEDDFSDNLEALSKWTSTSNPDVERKVAEIMTGVREGGDGVLVDYTNRFDRRACENIDELNICKSRLTEALSTIDPAVRNALESAAKRIRDYHIHQKQESWRFTDIDGTMLGQKITPLDRVGIYVPGGKACYPSSVLMNAIPARVAGVREVIMVVPAPDGFLSPIVLAAAAIADVDKVFTVGGAQAIAALAYGTDAIKKVDKIVGPGNIYVATAKRQVFGLVGLDMIAGPSEILVICDGMTDPDWIAMDLFSQAEHDEDAQSILISWDHDFIDVVHQSMSRLLPEMEREEIIRKSLARKGALIKVPDMLSAVELSNQLAPEHLELSVENPDLLLPSIKNAGAIFMGRHTAEAIGDYCAGPNHVLPTSATARFSSPLGVYDFQKRSSLIQCSEQSASALGKIASVIGRQESLTAHARSAEYRIIK
ncbi:MAG: histidinol dehydrogenase [Porticoccaceae bacterium]|nr:histidinol dehydrogenase [Porticoccaceae bacterium]PDH32061.1 MAG: histidinol dehydrogenase [SAR92 bacterium MED-G29]